MVLKVNVSPDLIAGDVDGGYGRVADVFRHNMTSGQEVGAAVAVYRDGVKVVDLWGGYRDGITKAPWQQDTVVNMFSTTKGVASLAVAVAASQGIISYDAKVADYWPEFAQAAKAHSNRAATAFTSSGAARHGPGPDAARPGGPGEDVGGACGAGPRMDPRDQTGIPRRHARLLRIRTHPPCGPLRAHSWSILRRGGRQTTRIGLLYRLAGLGGPQPRGPPARLVQSRDAAAPQHDAATFCGRPVQSAQPDGSSSRYPQGHRCPRRLQPRGSTHSRDTRC